MSLLRTLETKTYLLLRPVFASPKWYFPYDIIFDIKNISNKATLGSPKGGLNIGILLYEWGLLSFGDIGKRVRKYVLQFSTFTKSMRTESFKEVLAHLG